MIYCASGFYFKSERKHNLCGRASIGRKVTIALSPDIEREVRCVLAAGNKITAIRIVREASGAGLKAAKDFVDRM